MARIFFRLDDIAPNMDWDKFNFITSILRRYDIKPLLAVIPDNKDPELLKYPANSDFWRIIKELNQNGWVIAQHGFEHLYKTGSGGVLKINKKGEFAGLDLKTQKAMIANGAGIIKDRLSLAPKIFVAPGHSFDKNTIRALKENDFLCLSDGIALYPFKKWGLVWLPQVLWWPKKIWIGQITILIHINTEEQSDLNELEEFINKNRKIIGDFSELITWYGRQNIIIKFLTLFPNQVFKFFWRITFKLKHGLSR